MALFSLISCSDYLVLVYRMQLIFAYFFFILHSVSFLFFFEATPKLCLVYNLHYTLSYSYRKQTEKHPEIYMKKEHNNWNRNTQVPEEMVVTLFNFGNAFSV